MPWPEKGITSSPAAVKGSMAEINDWPSGLPCRAVRPLFLTLEAPKMCSIKTKAQSKRQSTMGPMSLWIRISQLTLANDHLQDLYNLRKDCWANGDTWEHELGKCLGQGKRSLDQRDETWSKVSLMILL